MSCWSGVATKWWTIEGAAEGSDSEEGGTPLHSFRTLLEDLANVTRNVCHAKGQEGSRQSEFEIDTQPSKAQERAMELLKGIQA